LPLLADFSVNSSSSENSQIVLSSPRPNTVYQMTSATDASSQQLQIEALASSGVKNVTLWVDGTLLANLTEPPYQVWWQLHAGEHRFWAEGIDASGETVKSEEAIVTVIGK
jgi:hypothetical protein